MTEKIPAGKKSSGKTWWEKNRWEKGPAGKRRAMKTLSGEKSYGKRLAWKIPKAKGLAPCPCQPGEEEGGVRS